MPNALLAPSSAIVTEALTGQMPSGDRLAALKQLASAPQLSELITVLDQVRGVLKAHFQDPLKGKSSGDLSINEIQKFARHPVLEEAREFLEFVGKFKISKGAESQIFFTLPKGLVLSDFLKEAQALACKTSHVNREDLIAENFLDSLLADPRLQTPLSAEKFFIVDGGVFESSNLGYWYQRQSKGWNNGDRTTLVVAYVCNFMLTGEDFFDGETVWCEDCQLMACEYGLIDLSSKDGWGELSERDVFATHVINGQKLFES